MVLTVENERIRGTWNFASQVFPLIGVASVVGVIDVVGIIDVVGVGCI